MATGHKRQIIDAYLLFQRSREELEMLQQESKLLVHYYQQRQQHIRAKLSELCTCVDRFSLGTVAMLKTLLRTNDVYLKEANMAHISLTNNVTVPIEDDYDSSDYSDCESDENISIDC